MDSAWATPPYMTLLFQAARALQRVGLGTRLLCAHKTRAQSSSLLESHLWRGGFPHSDICGSKLVCQLPAAFRRLPRPSSPVIAKASTTCTLSLDPITLSTPLTLLPLSEYPKLQALRAWSLTLLAFCLEARATMQSLNPVASIPI